MPLYDVTNKDKEVDPEDLENVDYMVKARETMDARTFDKIIRTTDTALDNLKPTKSSRFIWTKAGAIFGYSSAEPTRDVNHFWDNAVEVFGESSKLLHKFMGIMVMWRISLRDETWLMFREDTDEVDPDTGKKIKIATYWIDNSYEYPNKLPTVNDLMAKFKRF